MSDGIIFCFANCNRENMDPLPLIRVLSLAKFPLPAISYYDGQSKSANEKDKIEHEEMEPLIREFLDGPSQLVFSKPLEFFSISFYEDPPGLYHGLFRTDCRRETRNTMERLASVGISFLEFIIALQKAFSSSAFSNIDTNSVEDYLSGKANLEDRNLPAIAYGLPDEVVKAMLKNPANRSWETDIGVVYGHIGFCEGALRALSQKPEKGAQEGMSQ